MKVSRDGHVTSAQVRELLDYNSNTGVLTWRHRHNALKRWNVRYEGKVAGTPHIHKYVVVSIFKLRILAHRLAWLHYHGEWPKGEIDHVDGNPSNNAISNLRTIAHQQNSWNAGALKTNKIGHRYISYCKITDKYIVQFSEGKGKRIYYEKFPTLNEAIADRDRVIPHLRGEFFRKNTIPIDKNQNSVYP